MRAVAVALALLLGPLACAVARAEAPAPLDRLLPADGLFFDEPVAISPDGKTVAMLATDGGNISHLEVWFPAASAQEARHFRAQETPKGIDALYFIGQNRLLLVSKQAGTERHTARIAEIVRDGNSGQIVVGKRVLGPANTIMVTDRDDKQIISLYTRSTKKGLVEHAVKALSADGQTVIGHRSLFEDDVGQVTCRAGVVRVLWWSRGHTQLSAQKLGDYDKAHDFRRPYSFVKIDALTDKVFVDQPIDDVMGFARAGIAHKDVPDLEVFVKLSEDQRDLVLHEGLRARPIPLLRPIDVYDKTSVHSSVRPANPRVVIAVQVDPNNAAALGRKKPDPDEIDVYVADRSGKDVTARRVLVLPGEGRAASFIATADRLVLLRRGKGFPRGSVSMELFALP